MFLDPLFSSIPPELQPLAIPLAILLLGVWLSWTIAYLVSLWLILARAGRAGCLALMPLVNVYVLLRIAGLPRWSFLVLLLPPINLLLLIWIWLRLGQAFGRGGVFCLGLILLHPLFVPILAFSADEYRPNTDLN